MSHASHKKLLFTIICLILLPAAALAGELRYACTDSALLEHFKDVPCLEPDETSDYTLSLTSGPGVFEVSDNRGVSYSASSLEDAADGFLRIKGVCVLDEVRIAGQDRIAEDAIRFRIRTARGDVLHRDKIRKDIEEIYSMGYFESAKATKDGDSLTFEVREYPVIVSIEIKGNDKIKNDKIRDTIGLKKFHILNTRTLKTSIDRIKDLYREKGYYDVDVTSETEDTDGGIILRFLVDENKKLFVKKIKFDGNKHISDRKIRKVMQTKDRWFLGLFSHNGSYMDSVIDTDLLRIEQLYGDKGYVQAKAGRPEVSIHDNKGIYITIPISEGPLFHISSVDIEGDMIVPEKEIKEAFGVKAGDVMSRSRIQAGIEAIRDIYMDEGYAYARVDPITRTEGTEVSVRMVIRKGAPVHISRIDITGNKKTRDKVIRREMQVQEADLFSSTKLKRSREKLSRLGYFSSVDIEPIPDEEDTMSLKVKTEETTTGAFSFGVAYSSVDKFMGTMELSENNVKGLGLKTKLGVEYGKQKKNYTIDLEEPWLFDHPISVGLRLYDKEREEIYYTKKSKGGSLRMSYPLFEEVRHFIAYSYEDVEDLDDIDRNYEYLLSADDKDGGVTSSITNTLYRDTTNDFYRPTSGSDCSISTQYAGLGGDYHFTRTTARAATFFPVYKDKLALMLKGRWGTINGSKGDDVPLYELFTLGGMNTVRGFDAGEIGPRDPIGNVVGGHRMCIFNTELTFPIGNVPGLSGVVFFDAGNAYSKKIDLGNLKKSYGGGIRWVTPMGPMRLEYGKVINPESWESDDRWDFNIGTFF